jgi:hypothetical protein
VGAEHKGAYDHDHERAQGDLFALLEKLHAEDVDGLRKRLACTSGATREDVTHTHNTAAGIPPVRLSENWMHRVLGMVREYVVFVGVTCLKAFWAMVYYPNSTSHSFTRDIHL